MMEGVNSTMIYSKNFCKCHNNNNIILKKKAILKTECIANEKSVNSYVFLSICLLIANHSNANLNLHFIFMKLLLHFLLECSVSNKICIS
jgi:hypothetical protein